MNKNIIIAILVVIIIAIVAVVVLHPGSGEKLDTQITFLSGSSLQNGEQIQIELKDAKGNPVTNEIVNFTYVANGQEEIYAVYTNSEGKASLVLNNEDPGEHQVTVSFGGNDKLNPTSAQQTITIEDGSYDEEITSSGVNSTASTSSSENSNYTPEEPLYYDEETGATYNKEGIIVGGQNDGASLDYIKSHPQQVDEDGNLV